MRDFNNNNRGNNRSFGNSRSQHQMHDATCGDCGNNCKVPFMPSSGKPVYCSDCFEKRGNGKNDSRRPSFSNNRNFSDKRSFSDNNRKPKTDFNKRFDEINLKLDNILRLLDKQK